MRTVSGSQKTLVGIEAHLISLEELPPTPELSVESAIDEPEDGATGSEWHPRTLA